MNCRWGTVEKTYDPVSKGCRRLGRTACRRQTWVGSEVITRATVFVCARESECTGGKSHTKSHDSHALAEPAGGVAEIKLCREPVVVRSQCSKAAALHRHSTPSQRAVLGE